MYIQSELNAFSVSSDGIALERRNGQNQIETSAQKDKQEISIGRRSGQ